MAKKIKLQTQISHLEKALTTKQNKASKIEEECRRLRVAVDTLKGK